MMTILEKVNEVREDLIKNGVIKLLDEVDVQRLTAKRAWLNIYLKYKNRKEREEYRDAKKILDLLEDRFDPKDTIFCLRSIKITVEPEQLKISCRIIKCK